MVPFVHAGRSIDCKPGLICLNRWGRRSFWTQGQHCISVAQLQHWKRGVGPNGRIIGPNGLAEWTRWGASFDRMPPALPLPTALPKRSSDRAAGDRWVGYDPLARWMQHRHVLAADFLPPSDSRFTRNEEQMDGQPPHSTRVFVRPALRAIHETAHNDTGLGEPAAQHLRDVSPGT